MKSCGLLGLLFSLLLLKARSQGSELPAGCYESNYTSTSTMCDISFLFCYASRTLEKCTMRQCQKYVRAGDCYLWTEFILDNATCFPRCCGSKAFDETSCSQFNEAREEQKAAAQTGFIVGS
jgi:hypothetical protein